MSHRRWTVTLVAMGSRPSALMPRRYVRSWVPEVMGLAEPTCFAPWHGPAPESGYPAPCVNVGAPTSVGGPAEEAEAGPWHGHAADRVKVGRGGGALRFLDFDAAKIGGVIGPQGGEVSVSVEGLGGGGEAGGAGGMCIGIVPAWDELPMSWGRSGGIGWVVTTGAGSGLPMVGHVFAERDVLFCMARS